MDPGRWVRQEHQRLYPINVVETLGFAKGLINLVKLVAATSVGLTVRVRVARWSSSSGEYYHSPKST